MVAEPWDAPVRRGRPPRSFDVLRLQDLVVAAATLPCFATTQDGAATCFGGCTTRLVRADDCGGMSTAWPTTVPLAVEGSCMGGCAAGPGHQSSFRFEPAHVYLRRVSCKTRDPGHFERRPTSCGGPQQGNNGMGAVSVTARWVGTLRPGTAYVVEGLPSSSPLSFVTAGVASGDPCPEGDAPPPSEPPADDPPEKGTTWAQGHAIPYEGAVGFESITWFARDPTRVAPAGTFLGFGISHGFRVRPSSSSAVRSLLLGDELGLDWRARVTFGTDHKALVGSHGVRPVFRVAGNDSFRYSSILGALLPEIGVMFHSAGTQPNEVKSTSLYFEWALVPVAYRLGHVAIEWDGVRLGLGADGRWWSVATALSFVLVPLTR